ncbi:MAG: transglycosylase SLT domain-containing protein [Gammaproteobacteria bacterium]
MMKTTFRLSFILGITLLAISTASGSVSIDSYSKQRQQFLDALQALEGNDNKVFIKLKKRLQNYPLYSYLEYQQLRNDFAATSDQQISNFLTTWQKQPVSRQLYRNWLHHLGKNKHWEQFEQFYQPEKSTTLQCYHLRAQLQLTPENKNQTLKKSLPLWLVGHSQPDACEPLFEQLESVGMLSSDHRWERIRRAFKNNKPGLASYIGKKLSKNERIWLAYWKQAHQSPAKALQKSWVKQDSDFVREIIRHGLLRLARSKADLAWDQYQKLSVTHAFSESDHGKIRHDIALHAALDRLPEAQRYLNGVPENAVTHRLRRWRVRTALLNEDWKTALMWLDNLAPAERNSHEWQYWRAVSLEKTGQKKLALTTFAAISEDRNYYSFLAADKLNQPYVMNDAQEAISPAMMTKLEKNPAMIRSHEFFRLGMYTEARREWTLATHKLNTDSLKAAAKLAQQWGWHNRAIATAAQAKYWTDLDMRFPLAHKDLIQLNAKKYTIDPAIIYGVIRQESAFMLDARSSVGALGLMQLMPATARNTARLLKIRYPGKQGLLLPEPNIKIGSAYLKKLLDKYDNSLVLAATAYNAGPHRVDRWRPVDKPISAALWLMRIPFRETHGYVQKILAYATLFDWRSERPFVRLSKRMPDVHPEPKNDKIADSQ